MGIFSSKAKTTVTEIVDTQNINLQDIEGFAIAGVEGPVAVTLSDQGAIEAGRDIAFAGLEGFAENVDLTRDIIAAGRAQSETVAGLAGAVLERESTNVDPRLETITKFALVGAAVIVVVLIFKR